MFSAKPVLFLSFLCLSTFGYSQQTIQKCFKLPPVLNEVSGLYLQDANSFWWHNDSGGEAALFQTNGQGQLTDTLHVPGVLNVDWEDLTIDDKGNIYIGDFGNNGNRRKDLRILIYDPENQQLDSINFVYPDQQAFPPPADAQNFDMEAFFWHDHHLHLFSKNRIGQGNYFCKHYVLSDKAGHQKAILKDSIHLKKRVVTAAAISPDGKTIALLAYNYKKLLGVFPSSAASIFYISDFNSDDFFKGHIRKRRAPSFLLATQFESLDFLDDKTIYVASEKTAFIKPKAKRVSVK